jgi:hypothetical protein
VTLARAQRLSSAFFVSLWKGVIPCPTQCQASKRAAKGLANLFPARYSRGDGARFPLGRSRETKIETGRFRDERVRPFDKPCKEEWRWQA